MTGDPVTLVTPPHTDQCDYCMCIRLVNKHNESKPFQCIYTFKLHKQQRQIKCEQIQTRVVSEVTFITVSKGLFMFNDSHSGAIFIFIYNL